MLKIFKKDKKNNKGFTLVELVVVIAILAILVGLLAPQYTKYVEKARRSSDASNLENMVRAVEVAIADPDDTKRVVDGTYLIEISETKSSVKKDNSELAANTPAYDAIAEVLGADWESTKLKSKNWKDGTTAATAVSATIVVASDGSFSVKYEPKDLASMIGKAETTP